MRYGRQMIFDLYRALLLVWLIFKYGFGPYARRLLRLPPRGATPAERLRLALEELGLTYLKLGQYLAMRFDVLPAEVCLQLNRLYEEVSPITFAEAKAVVERELGGTFDRHFLYFSREPVASASVAQVHEARTLSDERVAVKVQRPGIKRIFLADIRNLGRLAALVDLFGLLGEVSLRELIEEFARWTSRELDFRTEAQTAERLRMHATANEVIPAVYWQLTTSRVLTLEFVEGVSLAQVASMIEEGGLDLVRTRLPRLDIQQVGRNLAYASLHQLFVTGFFHGDPHPGNILLRADNTIAFVDFGIFGELSDYYREVLARHIESIAVGNIDESFRYYSKMYFASAESDLEGFRKEGKEILRRWYHASVDPDAPIQDRHLGKYSAEMFESVRRHRLRMGTDTLLFWRAMTTLDSSALRLSGLFDLLGELRYFFEQIRPSLGQRLADIFADRERAAAILHTARSAPRRFEQLLDTLLRGSAEWRALFDETAGTHEARNAAARHVAVALNGVSLFVAGLAAGGRAGAVLTAAAVALNVWAISGMWSE